MIAASPSNGTETIAMRTYPTGVLQNLSAPGNPPKLVPVGEQNWRMFAPLAEAQQGLQMIQTVVPDAEMRDANEGQYSQFVYEDENPDIRVRLVEGIAPDCGGRSLSILEFPSDIFDRSTYPQPFIDRYSVGQFHVLRCAPASFEIGQLFWTATP